MKKNQLTINLNTIAPSSLAILCHSITQIAPQVDTPEEMAEWGKALLTAHQMGEALVGEQEFDEMVREIEGR